MTRLSPNREKEVFQDSGKLLMNEAKLKKIVAKSRANIEANSSPNRHYDL
jgi:hypothetical protein